MWNKYQIRGLRKKYGLTQTEFGELVGVSKNYIHLLEKGVKEPSRTLQILFSYIERDHKEGNF